MLLGTIPEKPATKVGNMINKGRGIKASLAPVVNPYFFSCTLLLLRASHFFRVKAELFIVLSINNHR